jgi:hypothetical protein
MMIELGGASDRLIFFSHPSHPKVVIHTSDHSVLDHPVLVNNPILAAQRAKCALRNVSQRSCQSA